MSPTIHVGVKPEIYESNAVVFDGETAEPKRVLLRVDEAQTALVGNGIAVPLADLREVPDQAEHSTLVLQPMSQPMMRIILPDRLLVARLSTRRPAPSPAPRKRLIGWATGAIASVALIVFVLVPIMADQLAEFIPPEGERALGEVTLNQIRTALDETGFAPVEMCETTAGRAALNQMQTRLTAGQNLPTELTVSVLDHEMVNAFALPGGQIVFFRGLLDAAETPEEIAAVFAHEIGHVVSRDPTRHALRSAGSIGVLGLLFGDFAGGALVLFLAERLIDAQYSQTAEADADTFAYAMLSDARVPPSALATMFERFRAMGGEADGIVAHFLSHPALGDRIEAARAATPEGFAGAPLLTSQEWTALKAICN